MNSQEHKALYDRIGAESVAIIGRTGSGKSYCARGFVEIMLKEKRRVCLMDPTGIHWGLRSSVNGKAAAFPVVVFGGDHGDMPITENSGVALAALIAGQNLPAIIDISEMSRSAQIRFATQFFEELYRANRQPLTIIIDEADLFAPQRAMPEQTVLLNRLEQIVRRGRVRGFRPWLISQRPAELHKSVLSQANTLVAMQLTAPQDRDAIGAWIEGQGDRDQGKKVLADLPKLRKGEGWVWSPSHDVLERVKFPAIATFDSSQAPEDGAALPPVTLAEVDLAAINESLKEIGAEQAANDPKALRRRIAELEAAAKLPVIEQAALDDAYRRGAREAAKATVRLIDPIVTKISVATNQIIDCNNALNSIARTAEAATRETSQPIPETKAPAAVTKPPARATNGAKGETIPKGERAILIAVAQHSNGCTREQLSVLTGYKKSSRDAYVQRLRERGFVDVALNIIMATSAGVYALGSDYDPLPTGPALLSYWMGRLPTGEAAILELVASKYPNPAPREWLTERSSYQKSSRDAYVQRLRSRQLVTTQGRGEVRASDALFGS